MHLNRTFADRHNDTNPDSIQKRLATIKAASLDQLIEDTVPASIRLKEEMSFEKAVSEEELVAEMKHIFSKNDMKRSLIGQGYYHAYLPNVIKKNILQNPGWYTAYTPYQAEIAQGRLEMLFHFQTLVSSLTQLPVANASLLDEATAAAEAMAMLFGARKKDKKTATAFLVEENLHPQTIEVLKTRAKGFGIELRISTYSEFVLAEDVFGLIVQNPDTKGNVLDFTDLFTAASEQQIGTVLATDLLALTKLKSAGEMGAGIAIGSAQRLGIPVYFGGPHAGFLACSEDYTRLMAGRIIGESKDRSGKPAYRMALQTREQHIRRERATSNICTAQVLLAVISAAYTLYHGAEGLSAISTKINDLTLKLKGGVSELGYVVDTKNTFDTLCIHVENAQNAAKAFQAKNYNVRIYADTKIGISLDERSTEKEVFELLSVFAELAEKSTLTKLEAAKNQLPERATAFLAHPSFEKFRTEHQMLRYLKSLENKDFTLTHGMIPLGSCTMKLNSATEMEFMTWPEVADMHPYAPQDQAKGYLTMIERLGHYLEKVTGFDAISFEPNSGAQGEYAGLLAIRRFHEHNGEKHRNIALIPSSAHGTNPASATMIGYKVVVVKCEDNGNIDLADLAKQIEKHEGNVACMMITYPSTHGVFEEDVQQACTMVHTAGGRVYMDGANMNAQVGLTSPGFIGADVCHLNLHKTFCIPHGGGGPGMGPIGVTKELAPFLPGKPANGTMAHVSAAPYGSASILTISYAYIRTMGPKGLTEATKHAILNANYLKDSLQEHYPVLYTGKNGRAAHEFIIDCRPFKKAGLEVADLAKRLMDYGFHAPTVSFPVAGTMMIEPTESEDIAELDRFIEAMVSIRKEIELIEEGVYAQDNNPLVNAPHTSAQLTADVWDLPYSREIAAFPVESLKENKFWPSVQRVDNAFGDRNLICSCIPIAAYETE